ncbi:hypothetical protein [Azospirillum sp. TSH64]|uniref:hypothetical protein n=1 Tax=Azospirillum sp. TSH64 TaxID=652740 RepID=UPI0011B1FEBD|nr:hypothetical protein [Azospirillum sp. TSH64]
MTFSMRALIALKSAKLSSPSIFSWTGGADGPPGASAAPVIFEIACADNDTVSPAVLVWGEAGDAVLEDAGEEDGAGGGAEGGADFSFVSNESGDMAPSGITLATMLSPPRKDVSVEG